MLLLVFATGCSYFSLENTNKRVYDATRLEVDEATGYKGLVYRRNIMLEFFDGNDWVFSLVPKSDQVKMTYTLSDVERYDIEGAYANGKELAFEENDREFEWDERTNDYKYTESFGVWFSLSDVIKASCEDGLKIAFIGERRHDVHLPKAILQGFLKKAKDLKVTEVEGNCFDYGGE